LYSLRRVWRHQRSNQLSVFRWLVYISKLTLFTVIPTSSYFTTLCAITGDSITCIISTVVCITAPHTFTITRIAMSTNTCSLRVLSNRIAECCRSKSELYIDVIQQYDLDIFVFQSYRLYSKCLLDSSYGLFCISVCITAPHTFTITRIAMSTNTCSRAWLTAGISPQTFIASYIYNVSLLIYTNHLKTDNIMTD
jgi:hypothetical protein